MNARIINLRTRRKQKARNERRVKAAANAAQFGQSKAETQKARTEAARDAERLDGHKLDDTSDDTSG